MGIEVALRKGACHLRLQGHGASGYRRFNPEIKAKHGGARGVQCLCEPLGEPACFHCDVEVRPDVGGNILPGCSPHVADVGDPTHGVHGSWSRPSLWKPLLEGGAVRSADLINRTSDAVTDPPRYAVHAYLALMN